MHSIKIVICLLNLIPFFKVVTSSDTILSFNKNQKEEWNGKWFPNPPNSLIDNNPTLNFHLPMGIQSNCDDAKTNLTIDWDNSPINYICFEQKHLYFPNQYIQPIETSYYIPKEYVALHKCMDTAIVYDDKIPTFGTHRPLWAKYGEYLYVPPQRWLHNCEHGAIILLYHPCANKQELSMLKKIVKSCLYKHIITPYTLLSEERPFALVAWGYSLEMSMVNPSSVISFIKKRALKGPEIKFEDGQYDFKLIKSANVVSDAHDSHLCPNF